LGVRAEAGFAKQRIQVYLIGLRIYTGPLPVGRRKDPKASPSQSGGSRREKRKMKGGLLQLLHTARTPHKRALLCRISRWLFFRARLEGRFGFDDPYATLQVEGALTLARTWVPTLGQNVTFDYVEPAFEGRLSVSLMIWLPRIAAGMIAFLFRREGRAMLRHYLARPKPTRRAA